MIEQQAGPLKHPVDACHHLPTQPFIGRVDQQPLERWSMKQGARQPQKFIVARPRQVTGFGLPHLFAGKGGIVPGVGVCQLRPMGGQPS